MESFLERLLAERHAAAPVAEAPAAETPAPVTAPDESTLTQPEAAPRGMAAPRIAVYDTLTAAPRVVTVEEEDLPALISTLAAETYRLCREQGGQVPYTVLRELIENLVHAHFRDVVVTVIDGGQLIRISDHGPGIEDKARALLPGFTTAGPEERRYIRGVGSGLPIAQESLAFLDGILSIEDNLGGGTVLTIGLPQTARREEPGGADEGRRLTVRQQRVLALLMELGACGPTAVGRELGVAAATAYRDLAILEEHGLVHAVGGGQRALTDKGVSLLDTIL